MSAPRPENLELNVLYADDATIVVDKPSGMYVHPAPGHETGTLVNAVLAQFPDIAGVGSDTRPGIVHRLDADTSGVMVLARTRAAYLALRRAFESHDTIRKTYLAVTHGAPSPAQGTLRNLIGRKPWDPKRMAVVESGGAPAVTHWQTISRNGPLALVEFAIETGRTHQIRVHAAFLKHPIAGDPLYGDKAADRRMRRSPRRTLLHAVQLEFAHPATGKPMKFAARPPNDILYAN